jgi:hypothetical protein
MESVQKGKKLKMFRALFGVVTAAFSLYVAFENFRKLRRGTQVVIE